MHTNIGVALKTQFYEFLVVECCISLDIYILQSLIEFQIAVFTPICHTNAVQDDIFSKTIRL